MRRNDGKHRTAVQRATAPASSGRRAGTALLEVLVALTILAVAGVAAVTLAAESAGAVRRAREADDRMRRASAFMDAVALWTRDDLDRRLGDRSQGPWRLTIDHPQPTLYVVTLADSGTGADVLHTALYRPEAARASR